MHGEVSEQFAALAAEADRLLVKAGGGSFCIYHRGEPVVDIWAGVKDPATGEPWARDTLGLAWSTSKGLASTSLHLLVDRGLAGYDDPVATYWPEFAANGKERVLIRHLLAMEAGLHDVSHLIDDGRRLLDWDHMCERLAAARPAHEPGTANAYHAVTYGYLVGELVRRISGLSVGAFVQRELAGPLQLDGCRIGLPAAEHHRVATPTSMPRLPPWLYTAGRPLNEVLRRLPGHVDLRDPVGAFVAPGEPIMHTPGFLEAEIPSGNGVYTARSLARIYAALGSDDGLDGVRLWSPETRIRATKQQNDRRDRVLLSRPRWRLGYHPPLTEKEGSPNAFGFLGIHGSGAFADPDTGVAVGVVCRKARRSPVSLLGRRIIETAAAADRAAGRPALVSDAG